MTANQLGNVTEDTGSYTPGYIATATRLVLTPKETPQSITVVTRQHMDDFGLNNVDDVMRHTPGITVSAFDSRAQQLLRPWFLHQQLPVRRHLRPLRATSPIRRVTP